MSFRHTLRRLPNSINSIIAAGGDYAKKMHGGDYSKRRYVEESAINSNSARGDVGDCPKCAKVPEI